MADDQPSGAWGSSFVILAFAAVSAAYVAWQHTPLVSSRPTEPEYPAHELRSAQDIDARLWEDPFAAVTRDAKAKRWPETFAALMRVIETRSWRELAGRLLTYKGRVRPSRRKYAGNRRHVARRILSGGRRNKAPAALCGTVGIACRRLFAHRRKTHRLLAAGLHRIEYERA